MLSSFYFCLRGGAVLTIIQAAHAVVQAAQQTIYRRPCLHLHNREVRQGLRLFCPFPLGQGSINKQFYSSLNLNNYEEKQIIHTYSRHSGDDVDRKHAGTRRLGVRNDPYADKSHGTGYGRRHFWVCVL